MNRYKKRKIKKVIIVITSLLVILFGVLLFAQDKENYEKPNGETNDPSQEIDDEQLEEQHAEETSEEQEVPETEEEPAPGNENPISEEPSKVITVENPEDIDVLVNKTRSLPSTYAPQGLVVLDEVPTVLVNPEVNQLRSIAYEALKELFTAAKEEAGYELHARSGYRSYNTQSSLYLSYVESYGQAAADKYSAKPGQSEHQTGLSLDITSESVNYQLSETFGDTDEGKWIFENAHRFGFIIRYPKGKETVTGYNYEPWHIRYLGTDLAKDVYESGLTLEEYLEE